jgi:predicted anti-sigma-YlaC factor YlaD
MNCNQIRDQLLDLAAGTDAGTPEIEKHLASCAACADMLQELRQTMALLDEWKAPEPSPYFNTRLQARLREEQARPHAAWLQWLRQPVLAVSLAAVLVAGAVVAGNRSYFVQIEAMNTAPPAPSVPVQPGTALGDLQALERNDDLYADFDMLDELQVQPDVTANP